MSTFQWNHKWNCSQIHSHRPITDRLYIFCQTDAILMFILGRCRVKRGLNSWALTLKVRNTHVSHNSSCADKRLSLPKTEIPKSPQTVPNLKIMLSNNQIIHVISSSEHLNWSKGMTAPNSLHFFILLYCMDIYFLSKVIVKCRIIMVTWCHIQQWCNYPRHRISISVFSLWCIL